MRPTTSTRSMSTTSGATSRHGGGRPQTRERTSGTRRGVVVGDGRDRRRPVVVLSRDAAIPRLKRALVAPCTTTIRGLASEVVLEPGSDPIPRRSAVNLDSVESVSIGVLVNRLGRLAETRMRAICAALEVAVDCSGWRMDGFDGTMPDGVRTKTVRCPRVEAIGRPEPCASSRIWPSRTHQRPPLLDHPCQAKMAQNRVRRLSMNPVIACTTEDYANHRPL